MVLPAFAPSSAAGVRESKLPRNRDAYYLTSTHFWGLVGYGAELGRRARSNAGLLHLDYTLQSPRLLVKSRLEYRNYQSGFGKDFIGQIEQQYVSYDQYDKAFTNTMNVFVHSDQASVYAVHLNGEYKINDQWQVEFLNEVGQFAFKDMKDREYYFLEPGFQFSL